MTIEEFRIGNIVDVFGECKIISISKKKQKIRIERVNPDESISKEWVPINSLSLNPVNLDLPKLESLGFSDEDYTPGYIGIDFNTKNSVFSNFVLSKPETVTEDQKYYAFEINRHSYKEIDSLHSLQNMFFSLTGIELIKNK